MSHIVIHRDHSFTRDQAREVAETIAMQLANRYEINHHWQDDSLHFERPGVNGQIDLEPSAICINVRLGLLLTPLKYQLEQQIHRELDTIFGAPPDPV
ncbi:MAG: polyhydroxyalkanoic acid system family protein [Candidatus Competibacteraceae bacterium]|nr:polyhydroxyalkanoic acid system family protein [Candidatus Competibacteraceae bacterium]